LNASSFKNPERSMSVPVLTVAHFCPNSSAAGRQQWC